MVLENGHVDDDRAFLGQNLRQVDVGYTPGILLLLKASHIAAEAPDLAPVRRIDLQTASPKIASVAIPHHNVSCNDAGLLQPLADGVHQHCVCRNPLAAQTVHFNADDLVLDHGWKPDELPRLHRILASEIARQCAIQKSEDAFLIQLRACAVKRRIPGHDHARLFSVSTLGQHARNSQSALRT